jgi:plasmid stability protein
MKTTIDLPDDLIRRIKLRALRDGRTLKDTVADLLRKGLAASAAQQTKRPRSLRIVAHKLTGLPVINCTAAASPDADLTPERLSQILLNQEVERFHDAGA